MKLLLNLKQFLNFEKVLFYTLIFILSLLCLRINIVHQAIGAESQDEPHISLKVKNQPLSDVLRKIKQETGFKFKLHNKWHDYPVNASIENMPLHRGLKIILQGLNHAIIYESDKSIKIMIYGEVDFAKLIHPLLSHFHRRFTIINRRLPLHLNHPPKRQKT